MRLGDIKAEALRLMFVNNDDMIKIEDLSDLAGIENYRTYLLNMNGSINRCFSAIERRKVLPLKEFQLNATDAVASGSFWRFDLSRLIPDYYDLERIVYECEDAYIGDLDYRREGNVLVLQYFDREGTYRALYSPRIKRLNDLSGYLEELDIPDEISCLIPYFIKGDLYRDDEPNEASEARNWFEQGLDELTLQRAEKYGSVLTVFSQVAE